VDEAILKTNNSTAVHRANRNVCGNHASIVSGSLQNKNDAITTSGDNLVVSKSRLVTIRLTNRLKINKDETNLMHPAT